MKTTLYLLAATLLLSACEKEAEGPIDQSTPTPATAGVEYWADVLSYKLPGQLVRVYINPLDDTAAVAPYSDFADVYHTQVIFYPGDTLEVRTRRTSLPSPVDTGHVQVQINKVLIELTLADVEAASTDWTMQRWIMPQ